MSGFAGLKEAISASIDLVGSLLMLLNNKLVYKRGGLSEDFLLLYEIEKDRREFV